MPTNTKSSILCRTKLLLKICSLNEIRYYPLEFKYQYLESGQCRGRRSYNARGIFHKSLHRSRHHPVLPQRQDVFHETSPRIWYTAASRHPPNHLDPDTVWRKCSRVLGSCGCSCSRSARPCRDTACKSSPRWTCCFRSHSGSSSLCTVRWAGDHRGRWDCKRGIYRQAHDHLWCTWNMHTVLGAPCSPCTKHIHAQTQSLHLYYTTIINAMTCHAQDSGLDTLMFI